MIPSGDYTRENSENHGIVFYQQWDREAKFADSGITRPLILNCMGDDGMQYRQLVKPCDDLRQVTLQKITTFCCFLDSRMLLWSNYLVW